MAEGVRINSGGVGWGMGRGGCETVVEVGRAGGGGRGDGSMGREEPPCESRGIELVASLITLIPCFSLSPQFL